MAAITRAQVHAAYSLAGPVYDGSTTFEVAAAELRDQHGLNISSARDFLSAYRRMLRGQVFKRSLSASALEYFLSSIFRERGAEFASNAVAASWKHIAYAEAIEKTRLRKLRSVVEAFQSSLSGFPSAQVEASAFEAAVVKSSQDSSAARMKRIKASNPAPATYFAITKVHVRNPDIVAEVLARAAGICGSCKKAAPFLRKAGGTPYLEVHHQIQLAQGGQDTLENAVALCPNCHRELHYGET